MRSVKGLRLDRQRTGRDGSKGMGKGGRGCSPPGAGAVRVGAVGAADTEGEDAGATVAGIGAGTATEGDATGRAYGDTGAGGRIDVGGVCTRTGTGTPVVPWAAAG